MRTKITLLIAIVLLSLFARTQTFNPVMASKLQNVIDSLRIAYNIKGISASVIYPGEGMWQGVTGQSYSGVPITTDMVFGIGSNTKLFTAVILLKLSESNIIKIDDSLYKWLPPIANVDSNITIRQLLNHTSGIADVTTVVGYMDSITLNPNKIYTPYDVTTWIGTPDFSPGTGWAYSNTNYLLAGMIAESASGLSYGQLLHNLILTPLQLDSTFLGLYDNITGTVPHPWKSGVDNNSISRNAVNSVARSAGAMYSTSGEMAQWYNKLMNGQVLNTSSFNEMTTFVSSSKYGFGISELTLPGATVWQHGGAIWGGYSSQMFYDTTSGAIVCVLINENPANAFLVGKQLLTTVLGYSITGISSINPDSNSFSVFPNPASSTIHIKCGSKQIQSVRVYNITGELMQESFVPDFSVSALPEGVYFIQVQTEDAFLVTRKFVKN